MNHDTLHRVLSVRSKLLDRLGAAALRFYLYRENAYFRPDLNGEHLLLDRLADNGISPGAIFDIGANEGRWSARVHQKWPNAQVHLFEPVPSIAARLNARFQGNDQIHIHHCAVGGEDGSVQFHENTELSSHSFVSKDAGGEIRLVSGATAFKLANISHLDLCKIDAEGFDLDILHGLEPQLKSRQISFIQFEHHALAVSYGRPFGPTSNYMRDLGYRIGKIFPDGLREIKYGANNWSNQIGPNFFAASPDHSDVFEALLSR